MKNFKNLWTLTFLMMTTQCFSIEDDEPDYNLEEISSKIADEAARKKDEAEKFEQELRNRKLLNVTTAEKTHLTVEKSNEKSNTKSNWLTKQFDKVSNWSNKRTLSKMLTENAKNDSSSQDDILFSTETKTNEIWNSLNIKDQQDLMNEWSKNRQKSVDKELARDHKKYTDAVNAYKSQGEREAFAKVDNAKKEIQKNEQTIAKLEQEKTKETSDTKKRLIEKHIETLKVLNKTQEEIQDIYLKFIEKERENRDNAHEENQKSIIANHVTKIDNFVNSMNRLKDSTVRIGKNSSDQSKSKLLEESTDQLDLAKEPKIQERVTINENEPALTADESEYNELAKKAKTIALSLPEFERIILLAKKVYGDDSFQYRIWDDELYKTKLDEQLKSGEKLPLPKSAPTETSVNAKKNDDDFEEFLKGFTSQQKQK